MDQNHVEDMEDRGQDEEKIKDAKETEVLYVGAKLILACPCDECTFLQDFADENARAGQSAVQPTREGYKVTYPDGYVSWSPKETFEAAYREVTLREKALF